MDDWSFASLVWISNRVYFKEWFFLTSTWTFYLQCILIFKSFKFLFQGLTKTSHTKHNEKHTKRMQADMFVKEFVKFYCVRILIAHLPWSPRYHQLFWKILHYKRDVWLLVVKMGFLHALFIRKFVENVT